MKMFARIGIVLCAASLAVTPAFAQVTAPSVTAPSVTAPAVNAPAAKAAMPAVKTEAAKAGNDKAQRTAKSLECSKDADGKKLHGKDRKKFMSTCKKA